MVHTSSIIPLTASSSSPAHSHASVHHSDGPSEGESKNSGAESSDDEQNEVGGGSEGRGRDEI